MARRLLLSLTLALLPTVLLAADFDWDRDYNSALTTAKAQNKLVLLVLKGELCRWCDKLEAETLKDPEVVALGKSFVPVLVDVGQNRELGSRYAKHGVPQTMLLDAEGRQLGQVGGYVPAPVFAAEMQRALENRALPAEIVTLEKTVAARPRDARSLARLGRLYVATEQESKGEPFLQRAQAQSGDLDAVTAAGLKLDLLLAALPQEEGETAPDLRAWVEAQGGHPRLLEGQYYAGYAAALKGDGSSALALWAEVLKNAPAGSSLARLAAYYSEIVRKAGAGRG